MQHIEYNILNILYSIYHFLWYKHSTRKLTNVSFSQSKYLLTIYWNGRFVSQFAISFAIIRLHIDWFSKICGPFRLILIHTLKGNWNFCVIVSFFHIIRVNSFYILLLTFKSELFFYFSRTPTHAFITLESIWTTNCRFLSCDYAIKTQMLSFTLFSADLSAYFSLPYYFSLYNHFGFSLCLFVFSFLWLSNFAHNLLSLSARIRYSSSRAAHSLFYRRI